MSEIPPRPAPPRRPADIVRQWIQWYGAARLALTVGSVLAVVVGALLLLRPSAPPVEATLPLARASLIDPAPQSVPPTVAPALVVVHVAGAVVAPGVYRLPPGARVVDALTAAGGATPAADPDAVNLAAVTVDGTRIYIPEVGETVQPAGPAAGGDSAAAAGPIDLNAATAEQLDTLPGIGPATAAAIVAHRQQHGPFGTVDDLGDVRGIGPSKLEALRGLVRV